MKLPSDETERSSHEIECSPRQTTISGDLQQQRATAPHNERLVGQNILVTGGAGFIGSHIVDAVVEKNAVTVLDNLSAGTKKNVHPEARFVDADLRDRKTLKQLVSTSDIVFHQAGLVSVEESTKRPTKSHAINVEGTVQLLDCARQTDTRVVTASSAAIYGSPSTIPVPETEPADPRSPYGVDKLAIDRYTQIYADLYDLPAVVLRYFNVYGPRQSATSYSGVISTFFEQATASEPLTIYGDGSQTRDFVHVSDVVDANLRAAQTAHTGTAYNIGTGKSTTVNELANVVCEAVQTDPQTKQLDERKGDIDHSCADISRARTKLEFEPAVDLEQGIRSLTNQSPLQIS